MQKETKHFLKIGENVEDSISKEMRFCLKFSYCILGKRVNDWILNLIFLLSPWNSFEHFED